MRTHLLMTYLFLVTRPLFAQQLEPADKALRAESYHLKSKHEMTAATVLVSGGAVMAIAGTVVYFRGAIGEPPQGENISMENTGSALMAVGVVCIAGSVPLFIMGARHRKLYRDLSFDYHWEPAPYTGLRGMTAMPAVGLKIKL